MGNTRIWEVEVTILMPSHALEIEAATADDAIKYALEVLNEAGEIPEHGECDVDIREKDPVMLVEHTGTLEEFYAEMEAMRNAAKNC